MLKWLLLALLIIYLFVSAIKEETEDLAEEELGEADSFLWLVESKSNRYKKRKEYVLFDIVS